nr:hypothetical protein [Tanacetum cinerariifolium]
MIPKRLCFTRNGNNLFLKRITQRPKYLHLDEIIELTPFRVSTSSVGFDMSFKTDTPNVNERERTPRVVVMVFKFQFNRDLVRDDKGDEFISRGGTLLGMLKEMILSVWEVGGGGGVVSSTGHIISVPICNCNYIIMRFMTSLPEYFVQLSAHSRPLQIPLQFYQVGPTVETGPLDNLSLLSNRLYHYTFQSRSQLWGPLFELLGETMEVWFLVSRLVADVELFGCGLVLTYNGCPTFDVVLSPSVAMSRATSGRL